MRATDGSYDRASLADLRERTEYEAWLLEAICEIVDERLATEEDQPDYCLGAPMRSIHLRDSIGDWRAAFLGALSK